MIEEGTYRVFFLACFFLDACEMATDAQSDKKINDSMIVPCGFFGFHQFWFKKLFPLVFIFGQSLCPFSL